MLDYIPIITPINYLNTPIDILRLDLIHPLYGGNKYFKLKYNIEKARVSGLPVLTFGGIHSNHIFSTAAYCHEYGISCIGVIGGDEKVGQFSPTMIFAKDHGMQLHFITREKYRTKTETSFLDELKKKFGEFYLIPEGGGNHEAVEGCKEILTSAQEKYDYIFCACGTGSTYAGLKLAAKADQIVIGISVLKGENTLIAEANKWLKEFGQQPISEYKGQLVDHSTILNEYHFGGYANYDQQLIDFKFEVENWFGIPLDYIYTAKLMYAVFDLLNNDRLKKDAKILIVHTGGLQGNKAYEARYQLIPIL
ncbi:MAG: 1-aminocyclopropane-carboxylate deaminase [Bacteroidetes bacterium]|nr:1-aminocyclopropane-carboxylate deaminase [Bacteroidota bacterium]